MDNTIRKDVQAEKGKAHRQGACQVTSGPPEIKEANRCECEDETKVRFQKDERLYKKREEGGEEDFLVEVIASYSTLGTLQAGNRIHPSQR